MKIDSHKIKKIVSNFGSKVNFLKNKDLDFILFFW